MMNYRYYIFVAFTTAIFTFAYCFSEYIKNSLEAKDWKFIPLNARDNREFGNVFVSGWLLNEHTGKLYHIGEIRFESEKSNEKPIFDLLSRAGLMQPLRSRSNAATLSG